MTTASTGSNGGRLLRSFHRHSNSDASCEILINSVESPSSSSQPVINSPLSTTKQSNTDNLPPSPPSHSTRSILNSIARPLLSSTPIGSQNRFSHKRRSSSGANDVHQNQSGGAAVSPEWSSSGGGGLFNRLRSGSKSLLKQEVFLETEVPDTPTQPESKEEVEELNKEKEFKLDLDLRTVGEEDEEKESSTPSLSQIQNSSPTSSRHSNTPQPTIHSSSITTNILPKSGAANRDLRSVERSLLTLLNDFQTGKLRAFSEKGTLERMRQVQEQQEKLAKLHFDLFEEHMQHGKIGEGGWRNLGDENEKILTDGLQELNESLQQLG